MLDLIVLPSSHPGTGQRSDESHGLIDGFAAQEPNLAFGSSRTSTSEADDEMKSKTATVALSHVNKTPLSAFVGSQITDRDKSLYFRRIMSFSNHLVAHAGLL